MAPLGHLTAETGVLDGRVMAATFNLLRGRDLIWNYVVNNYLLGKQPPAFDIVKDRIIQSQLLQKAQQSAIALRSKSKIEFVDPAIKAAIVALLSV